MKWFDRILTALRSAARDLISEEDEIEGNRVDTLIDAAQTRLTVLRDELAQAVAREKRRAASDLKRDLEDRAREVSKREDYLAAREEIERSKK